MSDLWPASGAWNLSYLPDAYGPLFGGGSVKQATINTLSLWLPSYVAEINRQLGSSVLTVPVDYLYQPDSRPVVAGTSAVTVVVARTAKAPERYAQGGKGAYRTIWLVVAQVYFAGAQDWNLAEATAWAYEAAVRGAIGQHPSLSPVGSEPFAETSLWVGSALGKCERSSGIWRVCVNTSFHVSLHNAMAPFGGPPAPSVAPPPAIPTVTAVTVTLSADPITESLPAPPS